MITHINDINQYNILIEYKKIEKNIEWLIDVNKSKQCGVQYRNGEDIFLSAVGKLQKRKLENEYNLLNPLFKDTIFEEIINKYKLVRSRLMWIERKTCYSLHSDPSKRLHVPIITNENCYFLFPKNDMYHLKLGSVYVVDTTKLHSFCNFSDHPRLHFMGCIND